MKLENNTANTPNVTRMGPTQLQDDFGSPVVPGGDHGAVVFPFKGGRAEIDQFDAGVPHPPYVFSLAIEDTFLHTPIIGDKEHIFRFQIRVGHPVVMHEFDGMTQLVGHVADLRQRVRNIIVAFQKVKNAFT